ncbi:hypothetical protein [Chroococcus sp. FPU101]|uniref:hypothetical protein n=1 Tax=Chroococcus sp. FPU101 TaxID=1974212 RepID=UPI001A8CC1C5|nr:hypothetical protein [Chroococcus sp. FPU101]GFE71252.1 hypothetical protein CFPU101_38620 [Chroococcus sp. FPU101]
MEKIQLDPKYLSFYGITIAFVLGLFKIVSSYGEHSLKAPPSVSGTYQIQSRNFPACLKTQALPLKIEQSGVFLFAHLANLPLDGRIKDNQINLMGNHSSFANCSFAQNTTLNIQASIKDNFLSGEIIWDETTPTTLFIAIREAVKETSPEKH